MAPRVFIHRGGQLLFQYNPNDDGDGERFDDTLKPDQLDRGARNRIFDRVALDADPQHKHFYPIVEI